MNGKAEKAIAFVESVELPDPSESQTLTEVWRGVGRDADEDTLKQAFATSKQQAAVAGSEIISFVDGVTPERRQAILSSALLAQLAAKKQVPDVENFDEWYKVYFDVLSNIGWVIQNATFAQHKEASGNFDAHKAIIAVATALMGPGAAGLALVKTTLEALQSMNQNDPWIKVFRMESHSARTARFQIGLATAEKDGQFSVDLMSFSLKATLDVVQVLFFTSKASEVMFKTQSGKVTIDTGVLDSVKEAIQSRLAGLASRYVGEIEL
jgi:hypothetical protein